MSFEAIKSVVFVIAILANSYGRRQTICKCITSSVSQRDAGYGENGAAQGSWEALGGGGGSFIGGGREGLTDGAVLEQRLGGGKGGGRVGIQERSIGARRRGRLKDPLEGQALTFDPEF